MADEKLKAVMKIQVTAVVNTLHKNGDKNTSYYFFSQSYNRGCDYHPDLNEHLLIAGELTRYLKKLMHW
jgi:hypothetical protein